MTMEYSGYKTHNVTLDLTGEDRFEYTAEYGSRGRKTSALINQVTVHLAMTVRSAPSKYANNTDGYVSVNLSGYGISAKSGEILDVRRLFAGDLTDLPEAVRVRAFAALTDIAAATLPEVTAL